MKPSKAFKKWYERITIPPILGHYYSRDLLEEFARKAFEAGRRYQKTIQDKLIFECCEDPWAGEIERQMEKPD